MWIQAPGVTVVTRSLISCTDIVVSVSGTLHIVSMALSKDRNSSSGTGGGGPNTHYWLQLEDSGEHVFLQVCGYEGVVKSLPPSWQASGGWVPCLLQPRCMMLPDVPGTPECHCALPVW
jgi:hypothetical protein